MLACFIQGVPGGASSSFCDAKPTGPVSLGLSSRAARSLSAARLQKVRDRRVTRWCSERVPSRIVVVPNLSHRDPTARAGVIGPQETSVSARRFL